MDKAFNRKTSRILSALVCIALIVGVLTSVCSAGIFARAEDKNEVKLFTTRPMHPTNNQFASTSGSTPKTPDSWTGGGVAGSGTGNVIGGVMELNSYASNRDSYKLGVDYPDEYPGNTSPDSPFGPDSLYEGTNRNVLFINIRPDGSEGTAYGYTSSSITFTENRFYKVSAWVRTGNFQGSNKGAAIRLNGLDDDVAFNNINTVKGITLNQDNNYGWEEYTFYIASSSLAQKTVTVGLQVGDKYVDENDNSKSHYYPATGYALFDNIEVYEIAPSEFLDVQKQNAAYPSENTIVKDYSDNNASKECIAKNELRNLDFTDDVPDAVNWQLVTAGETRLDNLQIGTYNGARDFDEDNAYHFSADPLSANGKYPKGDSDILAISSYRDGRFDQVAVGVSSKKFTIERYHYYRIAAWIKTQNASEGSGAVLALSAIRNQNDSEYEGDNVFYTLENCEGDTANIARGGYKEYAIYVKGSVFEDYEASVECRLGLNGNESSGIAMFDNVTVQEITPAQYADYGASASVDMDTASGVNGNAFRTFTDTGITNGSFYHIADYTEFAYPLQPQSWTLRKASNASRDGYSSSTEFVNDDGIISGIIPTDDKTFNETYKLFGNGVINPTHEKGGVLMLSSSTPTAVGYASSTFTATANTPGALSVRLSADHISGYGANLILKNNSTVLATIEKIQNTNGFKTYTFYIEPSSADISTLSVEIWLGDVDRNNNSTKLASGYVYVQSVTYENLTDDTDSNGNTDKSAATKFAEYKKAYDDARNAELTGFGQAAYSFKSIDFSAFDTYDTAYVKYPYNWNLTVSNGAEETIHYGIFNPNGNDKNASVPSTFENSEDATNYGVLMLHNAAPASSKLTYNGSIALSADTYYKIEVSMKVDIPEQDSSKAVGATLSLTGADYAFKNITDTTLTVDATKYTEAFRKFTFYIKTGSTDTSTSIAIALGGDSTSQACSGRVYINSITYTDITNIAYDTAAEEIENNKDAYSLLVDLSTKQDTDDGDETPAPKGELQWWLIPSILFAVAIVIAIVGVVIRKIIEKRANKKGKKGDGIASYDRTATLNPEHNKKATDDESKVSSVTDESSNDEQYESFDDTATAQTTRPVAKTTESAAEEEPAIQTAKVVPQPPEPATSTETQDTTDTTESTENAPESEEAATTETESPAPVQEEVAQPAEEKPEEKKEESAPAKKDDGFIDQFDD